MKNQKSQKSQKTSTSKIDARTVFMNAASETYGVQGEISRKELNALVKTLGTSYPIWFVSDKSRKVRWGVYRIQNTQAAANPTVYVLPTSQKNKHDWTSPVLAGYCAAGPARCIKAAVIMEVVV